MTFKRGKWVFNFSHEKSQFITKHSYGDDQTKYFFFFFGGRLNFNLCCSHLPLCQIKCMTWLFYSPLGVILHYANWALLNPVRVKHRWSLQRCVSVILTIHKLHRPTLEAGGRERGKKTRIKASNKKSLKTQRERWHKHNGCTINYISFLMTPKWSPAEGRCFYCIWLKRHHAHVFADCT